MLSDLAKKVYVVQNLERLTGEQKLQELLMQKKNVEVILGTTVESLMGDGALNGIVIKSGEQRRTLLIDGMFVAIGLVPQNEVVSSLVSLNTWGYIDAGENCQTGAKGIFVAGDCRSKRIRQVATACADGATAALAACDYVDSL